MSDVVRLFKYSDMWYLEPRLRKQDFLRCLKTKPGQDEVEENTLEIYGTLGKAAKPGSCGLFGFLRLIYVMCMDDWPACAFIPHVHAWWLRRSEEGVRSMELKLQTVVSHLMSTGNQTWIFHKSNNALHSWASSPALGSCGLSQY